MARTTRADSPLSVGDEAPDFTVKNQYGQDVTLSEVLRDKHVVLVFYPFAFTGICSGELDSIRDHLEEFVDEDLQVLTISCDTMYTLRSWADDKGYFFPMLSDFWPHGEVARAYGVFSEEGGMAIRGTFLIDRSGTIRWVLVHGPGEERDLRQFRGALAQVRAD